MTQEKKGWFKTLLEKYDAFCIELGINKGNCRGCVPVVKFDPETGEKTTQMSCDIKQKK